MTTPPKPRLNADKLALLALMLAEEGVAVPQDGIRPRDPALAPPLSFAQQRLWFLDQLESERAVYNIPAVVRFFGRLDPALLERSLNEVVRRHEGLRTRFPSSDGQAVQEIVPALHVALPLVDLRDLPADEREDRARVLASAEAQRPFDLAVGPLLRATLVQLGDDDYVFVLVLHHIVTDAWSMGILIREIAACAAAFAQGGTPALAPLPIQYADFAVWQRQWLQGEVYERQFGYWQRKLGDAPPLLELPTDFPRPLVQQYRGAKHSFVIPPEVVAGLKSLVRGEQTLFMVLLTAFKTLLYRYTGRSDILVGTPIANRTRPEIENVIGYFVNTLVLRTDLGGDPSFELAVRRVSETAQEAYAHQDLPFEKLVQDLHVRRSLSYAPLFQVMLSFQHDGGGGRQLAPGLQISPFAVETAAAKFDLTLYLLEGPDGLTGQLEYDVALFSPESAARMAGHFQTLLAAVAADPRQRLDHIPLMTPQEERVLVAAANSGRRTEAAGDCLHERFEAQAARTPQAVAVSFEGQQLTYAQLNGRANQLARRLRELGAGPETLVGLYLQRSLDLVVGLLAIVKAGAAYVPIDPDYPAERLAFMLADANVRILLTESALLANAQAAETTTICLDSDWDALARQSPDNLGVAVEPANTAYVIYTSGSTGKPKGTLIPHSNVMRLFDQTQAWFEFGPADVWTMFHSAAFDFSVWELWGALLYGGTVVVVPFWISRSPEDFYRLVRDQRVTVLNQTPSAFRQFMEADEANPAGGLDLRLVIFGGEALEPQNLRRWFERHGDRTPTLVNMYGITETTVHVSYRPLTISDSQSGNGSVIGGPIPDLQMYILDKHLRPVPHGVTGELYVGGAGLARGYFKRPGLTAERFLPNPWSDEPGARLYRSGDLARFRADGDIEHLGRADQQVKLRGFRIELGEIEAALQRHPGVQTAVVDLRSDAATPRLAAYIVPRGAAPATAELRAFLEESLPAYMVPATFTALDALPLTTNGKLDRAALPSPLIDRAEAAEPPAQPTTANEATLAAIWAQVLGRADVGTHDNFFELGGDSILSIQIVARAAQAGLHLTPRHIFEHQTVARLAQAAQAAPQTQADQGLAQGSAPLTPIQRWLFEQSATVPSHYNQALLFAVQDVLNPAALSDALNAVVAQHDALRLRFSRPAGVWQQEYDPAGLDVALERIDLSAAPDGRAALQARIEEYQGQFNLETGPLFRAVLFDLGAGETRLLLIAHHLVVDAVSWRIIVGDLVQAYTQAIQGAPIALPAKTSSFQQWALELERYAASIPSQEADWWLDQARRPAAPLPAADADEPAAATIVASLDAEATQALLQDVPPVYHTRIQEVLLTALAAVLQTWAGGGLAVDLEGHGREEIGGQLDLTRTVGWFTSLYPVWIEPLSLQQPGRALLAVKERLRQVPQNGVGYGALRYLSPDAAVRRQLAQAPAAQIVFNYLGQFDQDLSQAGFLVPAGESVGATMSRDLTQSHLLTVNASITQGMLQFRWTACEGSYRRATIERLAGQVVEALRSLIAHCQSPAAGGYSPADFALADLNQQQLDKILKKKRNRK